MSLTHSLGIIYIYITLRYVKGIDQFLKRPFLKSEMEALITNHVKEYVLTNT